MTATWFDASALPTGWQSMPIRRVGHVLNGGTPTSAPENWGGEFPFVTPPDLNGADGAVLESTSRSLSKAGTHGAGIAPADSVLVSTRAPIGHVGRIAETSAFNQGCRAVAPQEGMEPRYVAAALVAARAELIARGQGTTFVELSSSAFASVPIPIPPRDEQRIIADYLDHETAQIDALVIKQAELVRRLEERRLAVITTTALAGLRNEGAGEHDVTRWGSSLAVEPWLQRAPRSWGVERFKTLCLQREERNSAGIELMLSLTVKGHLTDRSARAAQQNAAETSIPRYFVARPGDLVVNPMWLVGGAIGVSDKRGAVSPDYRVFEISEKLDPWYLHAVLRSAPYFDQYKLYTRANTTFDRRIKQNDLDNLPIPVPPLDEQRAIVEHVRQQTTQIDALIAKAEEHIALAKERRSALIAAAVTGQIDVRTAKKGA